MIPSLRTPSRSRSRCSSRRGWSAPPCRAATVPGRTPRPGAGRCGGPPGSPETAFRARRTARFAAASPPDRRRAAAAPAAARPPPPQPGGPAPGRPPPPAPVPPCPRTHLVSRVRRPARMSHRWVRPRSGRVVARPSQTIGRRATSAGQVDQTVRRPTAPPTEPSAPGPWGEEPRCVGLSPTPAMSTRFTLINAAARELSARMGEGRLARGMEFCLLGPLVVRREGAEVPIAAARQRVVLAALLLRANQVVPVGELAGALWDEAPPPTARATVRNYVKRLRRALGDVDRLRIATRGDGYLIGVAPGELDLDRFETLRGQAGKHARAGRWAEASAALHEALSLWRGQPLADVPSDVLARREGPRLAEARLQAAEDRFEADLQLGRHGEVIAGLRQLA